MPEQNDRAITLEDLAKQRVRNIPVSSVQADYETQTRITTAGTKLEQEHAAKQSRLIVKDIKQSAQKDAEWELPNPIMVAEVAGKRKLIDGHHRLEAFKQAGRGKIRAYVLEMTENDWKRLAIQANSAAQIVPEGGAERREKAWELIKVAHNGERWVSPTDNNKRVAERHGISRGTVISMVKIRKELEGCEDLPRMSWYEAQVRSAEFSDRDFDEKAERDPAIHAAGIAQKLVDSGNIHSLLEGAWLLKALYHLLTDNEVPYGLTSEELVEYIKANHDATEIGFDDPLITVEERF